MTNGVSYEAFPAGPAIPLNGLPCGPGLVPRAAAEAWGGMALSGVLIAAVRTGLAAQDGNRADPRSSHVYGQEGDGLG